MWLYTHTYMEINTLHTHSIHTHHICINMHIHVDKYTCIYRDIGTYIYEYKYAYIFIYALTVCDSHSTVFLKN